MTDRLTYQRVIGIADGDSVDIARFASGINAGGPLRAVSTDAVALARRVLNLEAKLAEAVAIARETVDAMTELLTGEVPAPDLDDLRARLAQIGGKDG